MSRFAATRTPSIRTSAKVRSEREPSTAQGTETDHVNTLLRLQQSAGNTATQSLLHSGLLQPKLRIAPANDEFEREADHVADAVTRAAVPVATVQWKCAACDEEEMLRRKADGERGSFGSQCPHPCRIK